MANQAKEQEIFGPGPQLVSCAGLHHQRVCPENECTNEQYPTILAQCQSAFFSLGNTACWRQCQFNDFFYRLNDQTNCHRETGSLEGDARSVASGCRHLPKWPCLLKTSESIKEQAFSGPLSYANKYWFRSHGLSSQLIIRISQVPKNFTMILKEILLMKKIFEF